MNEKYELLRHYLAALAYEVAAFHEMIRDLARHLENGTPLREPLTPERVLQGPFADAMTHAGQLAAAQALWFAGATGGFQHGRYRLEPARP